MMSLEVIRTRHHIRRFLRRSLVLKFKPNTCQTTDTMDNIERRRNMAKSEGRVFLTVETLKLDIVVYRDHYVGLIQPIMLLNSSGV